MRGFRAVGLPALFAATLLARTLFARTAFAQAPAPPAGAALSGLTFPAASGWQNAPKALNVDINVVACASCEKANCASSACEVVCPDDCAVASVINTGHEDSPFISPDGSRLYFAYAEAPLDIYNTQQCLGPHRHGQNGIAFDVYDAVINANPDPCLRRTSTPPYPPIWTVANSLVNAERRGQTAGLPSLRGMDEGSPGVRADGLNLVFARYNLCPLGVCPPNLVESDVWLSASTIPFGTYAWGTPAPLPINGKVNTVCSDDNPHMVNAVVYFDSNRVSGLPFWTDPYNHCMVETPTKKRRIWYTVWLPIFGWLPPVELGGVNAAGDRNWQVFITTDAQTAYWTGNDPATCCDHQNADGDCNDPGEVPVSQCLYRAQAGAGGYTVSRTLIAYPEPDDAGQAPLGAVVDVGEPSVTQDGTYLYFEYRAKIRDEAGAANDQYDTSIGFTPRLP